LRPDDAILSAENVSMRFKGLLAVDNVSLSVTRASITALIGPNGAGKSTLFNCLTGFLRPTSGRVSFDGSDVGAVAPHKRVALGLARTFQVPRIFQRLTVLENLLVADTEQPGDRLLGCFYSRGAMKARAVLAEEKARRILALLAIERLANDYAGTLSGGQRKLLELGRVLMADPKMIMLDEPMAGVNPALGLKLLERVEQLRAESGLTFLFVEHDMDVVMRVSDRVLVLDEGRLIADGLPDEIRANERVVDAYLGRAASKGAA